MAGRIRRRRRLSRSFLFRGTGDCVSSGAGVSNELSIFSWRINSVLKALMRLGLQLFKERMMPRRASAHLTFGRVQGSKALVVPNRLKKNAPETSIRPGFTGAEHYSSSRPACASLAFFEVRPRSPLRE
jgi:hypothetical protein